MINTKNRFIVIKFFIKTLFLVFFTVTFISCGKVENTIKSSNGYIDISNYNFDGNSLLELNGEWDFYWNKLLENNDLKNIQKSDNIKIPGHWNRVSESGLNYPKYGYSTIVLKVKLKPFETYGLLLPEMRTSYIIFMDDREIFSNGKVAKTKQNSQPSYVTGTYYFTPLKQEIKLICQVSNYDYRKSGMWRSIKIGKSQQISKVHSRSIAVDLFLCGSMLIMAFYHIALFLFRKQEKSTLYFGIFCFIISLRLISTGEKMISYFFPDLPWGLLIRMELSPFYLGGIFFLMYFKEILPEFINKIVLNTLLIISAVFALIVMFFPVSISNNLVTLMELVIFAGLIVIIFWILKAVKQKKNRGMTLLFGFALFFICGINDILYSQGVIHTFFTLPFGLFGFILSQSVLLARLFSKSFKDVENLSLQLKNVNEALERFVPSEFLKYLSKESIVDVKLGDQTLKEMTILFSDIESFTTMSENMNPQENFNFLNSYLSRMGPVIRGKGGFIDKYIGDAIMALFPNNHEDAVSAAVEMHKQLIKYNKDRSKAGYDPINIGTGIHAGDMMLGIIGEEKRLESTVISDSVNLASRIERLTRIYKVKILISGSTLLSITNLEKFDFRIIDVAKIKGKTEKVSIFEIYSCCDKKDIVLKNKTKTNFEKAVLAYHSKDIEESQRLMKKVLKENPDDYIARLYKDRSKDIMENGIPLNWELVL